MKLRTKITSLCAAMTMALGVGVAVSAVNGQMLESKAEAVDGEVTLKTGVYNADGDGSGVANIAWNETYWNVIQHKGLSDTVVNPSYTSAPRVYKGNYLTFEAPDGITFNKITIKPTGSKYIGSDLTYFASTTSNAARPEGTSAAVPTNGIALTAGLTITTPDLSSAKSVFIQNSYGDASSSYKQLRPSNIIINYTSTIVVVNPTSINVSFASPTLSALGATTQATAEVLPADATDKSVDWTSSNESVAVVSPLGLVTAIGNGSANIIATSKAVATVSGQASVTVSAAAATNYDKVLTYKSGFHEGGYGTGNVFVDAISYSVTDIGVLSGAVVLQGKANSGDIKVLSGTPKDIKTITITLAADGTPSFTLNVGATVDAISTAVTPVVTGAVAVYTIDAGIKFFEIKAGSSYFQISSIVVEMIDTDVEAARTYAKAFLTATDAECAALAVTSTTWDSVAVEYAKLSETAKAAFAAELNSALRVTDIQKAVSRYTYIVNLYGYTNFMGLTVSPANVATNNPANANGGMIAIIAIVSVVAIASCVFVVLSMKKRKAQ